MSNTKILLVAPRDLWKSIHSRIEPALQKIACRNVLSREYERREPPTPYIIVSGLTPEAEAVLLDALNGFEPIIAIVSAQQLE